MHVDIIQQPICISRPDASNGSISIDDAALLAGFDACCSTATIRKFSFSHHIKKYYRTRYTHGVNVSCIFTVRCLIG